MPKTYVLPGGDLVIFRTSVTLSPALIVLNTSAEQLFTCPGVLLGDDIIVKKPTAQAGLYVGAARVSAADQIGITFGNWTGSSITPTASEVYTVTAIRG